jgi:hypothetical protein
MPNSPHRHASKALGGLQNNNAEKNNPTSTQEAFYKTSYNYL